jgi:hypothetical protein
MTVVVFGLLDDVEATASARVIANSRDILPIAQIDRACGRIDQVALEQLCTHSPVIGQIMSQIAG